MDLWANCWYEIQLCHIVDLYRMLNNFVHYIKKKLLFRIFCMFIENILCADYSSILRTNGGVASI